MSKQSLRQLTENYLEHNYPNFIHKGDLEKKAINEWGYEGDNLARRCRELERGGVIEKKLDNKGRVWYKYIKNMPSEKKSIEMPLDDQLKNILFVTKPTWENAGKIKEINKAIKSKHKYYKKMIITKYK